MRGSLPGCDPPVVWFGILFTTANQQNYIGWFSPPANMFISFNTLSCCQTVPDNLAENGYTCWITKAGRVGADFKNYGRRLPPQYNPKGMGGTSDSLYSLFLMCEVKCGDQAIDIAAFLLQIRTWCGNRGIKRPRLNAKYLGNDATYYRGFRPESPMKSTRKTTVSRWNSYVCVEQHGSATIVLQRQLTDRFLGLYC